MEPAADLTDLDRRAAEGCAYLRLLHRIHEELRPRGYVEIGVRHGDSLRLVGRDTVAIGIDPEPDLTSPLPANATLHEQTSDDFFAAGDLHAALDGRPLDLAFVDGMHLFEFALRDFVNLERHAHAGSTVLVHDCLPTDADMAGRERTTFLWAGDVWKLVLCLRRHRPDLDTTVVDVSPTGLGVIRNLDPTSTVLADRMDELVATYVPMSYEPLRPDVDDDWGAIATVLRR